MTQGQGGTPAGWYPDPEGNGDRWWNGMSWGELRAQPAVQAQPYPTQQYDQSQSHPSQTPAYIQSPAYNQGQTQQAQAYVQPPEPAPHQQPAGPDMHCVHCQWNDFQPADYLLINPRGTTPFNPETFNFSANCLICRRCGFIHWFAAR
ncbi:MAG: DUF2510 domain-containing protein [Actinomycetota bacterium]|nr:DUF2510 domain-containing protein [Actinomycetota bacterium]MDQ3735372.1 DUF2510 domain-containing protein [Actinomycetota bacterium]